MTERQSHILQSIIETYAKTAEPVGSLAISRDLGYSPATIRTEMVGLEQQGYIRQPHTSAGRIPTDRGYRSYVNNLTAPDAPRRVTDVVKKRVESTDIADKAIKAATDTLAQITHNVGLATIASHLYYSGFSQLFSQPEFASPIRTHEAAQLLDGLELWLSETAPGDRLNIYIGTENPVGKASECSLIIARFNSPYSENSFIGVMGPTRQNYREVMGLVDYTGRLLEEALV